MELQIIWKVYGLRLRVLDGSVADHPSGPREEEAVLRFKIQGLDIWKVYGLGLRVREGGGADPGGPGEKHAALGFRFQGFYWNQACNTDVQL